jgi:electron transport complex protein RnfG
MLGQSVGKNSLILGAFALVTASVLALTHQGTKTRIAEAERAAAQKALFEVLPEEQHDNDLLDSAQPIPREYWGQLGLRQGGELHVALKNGALSALIVPAIAPDGYSGDIRLLIGINADGTLSGVRVLSHSETPGLGDKMELSKSDWILGFTGKSLQNPNPDRWKVKKDGGAFDQFTGATITPRAVVNQVRKTLALVEEHRDDLLAATQGTVSDAADTTPTETQRVRALSETQTALTPEEAIDHE